MYLVPLIGFLCLSLTSATPTYHPSNTSRITNSTETNNFTSIGIGSFAGFIASGIAQTRQVFPSAQVFRVSAVPYFDGTTTDLELFRKIAIQLDDGRGAEILIATRPRRVAISWGDPVRKSAPRPMSLSTFEWSQVAMEIKEATNLVSAAGYPEPYHEIEVVKYARDATYPDGQTYYTFVNVHYESWVEVGTVNRRVYPHWKGTDESQESNLTSKG